jgi:hypothetical protein
MAVPGEFRSRRERHSGNKQGDQEQQVSEQAGVWHAVLLWVWQIRIFIECSIGQNQGAGAQGWRVIDFTRRGSKGKEAEYAGT